MKEMGRACSNIWRKSSYRFLVGKYEGRVTLGKAQE
jgi:hypothetical protein